MCGVVGDIHRDAPNNSTADCAAAIGCKHLIASQARPTDVKTRIVAHNYKQKVVELTARLAIASRGKHLDDSCALRTQTVIKRGRGHCVGDYGKKAVVTQPVPKKFNRSVAPCGRLRSRSKRCMT